MPRAEFTQRTKEIAARRAGFICSIPECSAITIGPGSASDQTSSTGKASHIFSAAENGPRKQGGLTEEELKSQENCIWLCSHHATLIDNNEGNAYPAELLVSYKALHEARVLKEHQGLYSPVGWLNEIIIHRSPIFNGTQKIYLSKMNLIVGDNGSGKTAITEWLGAIFNSYQTSRWENGFDEIRISVKLFNPQLETILTRFRPDSTPEYRINGKVEPFNPVPLKIFYLRETPKSEACDDINWIANNIGISPKYIRSLSTEIEDFEHSTISNIVFEDTKEGTILRVDVEGTAPGLSLSVLSHREQERVFIEYAVAAARVSGRYMPTVLVLDDSPKIIFDGFYEFYSKNHFLNPLNQFQTILCVPTGDFSFESIRWLGWEVIRNVGRRRGIEIEQDRIR